MTDISVKKQIAEQISALKEATKTATKSKEAASKYLIAAGILQETKNADFSKKSK